MRWEKGLGIGRLGLERQEKGLSFANLLKEGTFSFFGGGGSYLLRKAAEIGKERTSCIMQEKIERINPQKKIGRPSGAVAELAYMQCGGAIREVVWKGNEYMHSKGPTQIWLVGRGGVCFWNFARFLLS